MNIPFTENEIYEQIDKATDTNGNMSGMTYEDGVIAALDWILCRTEGEPPIED